MDAEIERFLQIRRQGRQHGDAAGDVKAAHDDVEPERAELPAEIERARILVRLHADQPDHAAAGGADALGHRRHIDDGVALVAGVDLDVDVGAEHAVVGALPHQPVDAGERVRRQGRAQPLDDIAILVVVRRLDQLDPKGALGQITVQITPPNGTQWFLRQRCQLCGLSCRFATITFPPRCSGDGTLARICRISLRFVSSGSLTLHKKGRRSADRRNCPRSTPRRRDVAICRRSGRGRATGAHAYRRSAAALA